MGELDEEKNKAFWSLALFTCLEVHKANWEIEVPSLERDGLVEDLATLRKRNILLGEKA